MDPIRTKIAMTALFSRAAIFGLSVVSNAIVPDHDAGVFKWTITPIGNADSAADASADAKDINDTADDVPTSTTDAGIAGFEPSASDRVVSFLTDGLSNWDGQYFLHVANNGYTYENTLAFFPLYPAAVRAAGEAIHWLQVDYGLIHVSSALRLAAALVSAGSFVAAALALFSLTRKVLRDDYLAYRAALLFCCSPASVFFSAAYSESLYCALTFYALLKLERGFSIKAALLFAAASACRANALVNLGFILYKGLRLAVRETCIHRRLKQLERADLGETVTNIVGDAVVPAFLSAAAAAAPFALFQWFAFTTFCGLTKPKNDFPPEVLAYADDHGLKVPSADASPWCRDRLPLPYSYVQSHYWDVGFLRYFQLRQVPNFLLAAPVLYLVAANCKKFFSAHRFYSRRLGCTYFQLDPAQKVPPFDMYSSRVLPKECFVYAVHASALAAFCLTCAHVQVSTRLIMSSSPLPYWLAALLTSPAERRPFVSPLDLEKEDMAAKLESRKNLEHSWRSAVTDEPVGTGQAWWIKFYFVSYAVAGTVLFSNFLPWT